MQIGASLAPAQQFVDTIRRYAFIPVPEAQGVTWTDALEAWSTFFAVVFAAIAARIAWKEHRQGLAQRADDLERLKAEEAARRAAVDARISAIAYALRLQLQSWDSDSHRQPGVAHKAGVVLQRWRDRDHREQDRAEARLNELMALAPSASPKNRTSLHAAFVSYYGGVSEMNYLIVATARQPAHIETSPDVQGIVAGMIGSLTAAIEYLGDLIEPELAANDQYHSQQRRNIQETFRIMAEIPIEPGTTVE